LSRARADQQHRPRPAAAYHQGTTGEAGDQRRRAAQPPTPRRFAGRGGGQRDHVHHRRDREGSHGRVGPGRPADEAECGHATTVGARGRTWRRLVTVSGGYRARGTAGGTAGVPRYTAGAAGRRCRGWGMTARRPRTIVDSVMTTNVSLRGLTKRFG